MSVTTIFRPGMRAYFIPFAAGIILCVSAFLPWVIVGGVPVPGAPDVGGLWIAGLGGAAMLLAVLSLITRKNSRHPLLLVGLIAFGILFLSWRILPVTAGEHALTVEQALAIVENRPVTGAPTSVAGIGIYIGLVAATVLVAFGLTIVVKRVARPYVVESADDDVE